MKTKSAFFYSAFATLQRRAAFLACLFTFFDLVKLTSDGIGTNSLKKLTISFTLNKYFCFKNYLKSIDRKRSVEAFNSNSVNKFQLNELFCQMAWITNFICNLSLISNMRYRLQQCKAFWYVVEILKWNYAHFDGWSMNSAHKLKY